jgi:hypothetical protein
MSDKEVVADDTIQLDLTQVLAAIIRNQGIVAVPSSYVFDDYSDQRMALSVDEDTNMLVLELVKENEIES